MTLALRSIRVFKVDSFYEWPYRLNSRIWKSVYSVVVLLKLFFVVENDQLFTRTVNDLLCTTVKYSGKIDFRLSYTE